MRWRFAHPEPSQLSKVWGASCCEVMSWAPTLVGAKRGVEDAIYAAAIAMASFFARTRQICKGFRLMVLSIGERCLFIVEDRFLIGVKRPAIVTLFSLVTFAQNDGRWSIRKRRIREKIVQQANSYDTCARFCVVVIVIENCAIFRNSAGKVEAFQTFLLAHL